MSSRRAIVYGFLIAVVALFLFGSAASYFFFDYLWFASLGFESVFTTMIASRVRVALVGGLFFFAFMFANLWASRWSLFRLPGEMLGPRFESLIRGRALSGVIALVSLLLGALAGLSLSGEWLTVERFLRAQTFGVAEPIFNLDVGFYVFSLPFLRLLNGTLGVAIGLSILLTALVYFFSGSINVLGGRLNVHPGTRLHLSVLLALFLLNRAWGYHLAVFNIMYSERGVTFGAAFTDVNMALPALRVLTVVAVMAAVLVLLHHFRRDLRLVYLGLGLLILTSLVGGTIIPALVQEFHVRPNEISLERPFIEHNIALTREAFDLERIEEEEYPLDDDLTWRDIEANQSTVDNIRLWDWEPLSDVFHQVQTFRVYYDFADVDISRYYLNGEYRQVLLAAREIDYPSLPAQTWINLHLKFTHGHGVVMASAAEITDEGMPDFLMGDVPVRSRMDMELERPEIYFGEKTDIYSIVNTDEEEYSYFMGDTNVYTHYEGQAGVNIGTFWRRAALALRLNEHRIMFSTAMNPDSRVLLYRNIHERVRKVAPFLAYDRDPYVAVIDGRLKWIQDAYSITNLYPYSEPAETGWNYIRNSVKVVIDAYDGDMDFYLMEPDEPIAGVYQDLFPDLFTPLGEMPAEIQAQIRYPQDLFEMQMDSYLDYHMTDPRVFYNKEARWERPVQTFRDREVTLDPYYVIMRLPGEQEPEFLQMMPLTPVRRNNMIAWLGARCDPGVYGQLVLYHMPKDRLVFGPAQIEARIDQDEVMSESMTLWGQAGSEVIRGNLMVIPMNGSLLYVEPIYLQAEEARLPELRRVVVGHGPSLTWAPTLDQALRQMFDPEAPVRPDDPVDDPDLVGTIEELISRARELYDQAQTAIQAGRWGEYGRLVDELGGVLERIEELTGSGPD